jgi:FKBP-type peptidyl-prolyl cis-trans isomerase SlpA
MQPRPGDTISLHYRLSCAGRDIVNTFPEDPETFTLGCNEMDPRLEVLVLGLEAGQHATFHLEPVQAFGFRDEALVHLLALDEFPDKEAISVGNYVEFPMPNGEIMLGTIVEVRDLNVKVDFNHPLAGLPIELELELLDVNRTRDP